MGIVHPTAIAVAVLAASSFAVTENRAESTTDSLAHLAGRWIGKALMTPTSGPQASFDCIVTYLPRSDGPGLKQNFRCDNGTDFKIHAATELEVHGASVTGRWQDKINNMQGTLVGDVTNDGFTVQLSGDQFQAAMAVSGQGCEQIVKVTPEKSDPFQQLAATLKKC